MLNYLKKIYTTGSELEYWSTSEENSITFVKTT